MVDGRPERRPASAQSIAEKLRSLDARHAAREAERVSGLLVRLFETSDPAEARGADLTAREVLERGAKRLEGELGAEPAVLARMLGVVGRVHQKLGDYGRSEELLRKAAALGRESLPELARAEIEHDLASLLVDRGRYAEAEALFREILADAKRVLGPSHFGSNLARYWLACSLVAQHESAEASGLIAEAVRAGYVMGPDGAKVCIDILRTDRRIWAMLSPPTPGSSAAAP